MTHDPPLNPLPLPDKIGDKEGTINGVLETEYPIFNKEYPISKGRIYDLQEHLIDYAV